MTDFNDVERKRLQFDASRAVLRTFEFLESKLDVRSRADIIRKGLKTLEHLVKIHVEDGEIILLRKDGTKERLTLF